MDLFHPSVIVVLAHPGSSYGPPPSGTCLEDWLDWEKEGIQKMPLETTFAWCVGSYPFGYDSTEQYDISIPEDSAPINMSTSHTILHLIMNKNSKYLSLFK